MKLTTFSCLWTFVVPFLRTPCSYLLLVSASPAPLGSLDFVSIGVVTHFPLAKKKIWNKGLHFNRLKFVNHGLSFWRLKKYFLLSSGKVALFLYVYVLNPIRIHFVCHCHSLNGPFFFQLICKASSIVNQVSVNV